MDYIVLVKEVPEQITFDELGLVDYEKSQTAVNEQDLHALEAALALREESGDGKVLAVHLGYRRDALQEAVSMGADHGYLIDTAEVEGWDGRNAAAPLASVVKKLIAEGDVSEDFLLFAGSVGADYESGQAAIRVAEMLGIPQLTYCEKIEAKDGEVTATINAPGGYARYACPLPALLTVTETANEIRFAPIQRKLKAKRDSSLYTVIPYADLASLDERTELVASDEPPEGPPAKVFQGGDAEEMVDGLLRAMREDGRTLGGAS